MTASLPDGTTDSAEAKAEPTPEEIQKKNLVIGLISNGVCLAIIFGVAAGTNTVQLAMISIAVNWGVFLLHGFPFNSEKFFDATGTLTYVTLAISSMLLSPQGVEGKYNWNLRQIVLSVMMLVWSIRLGSYLLARIMRDGKDARFDVMKTSFLRWLGVWTVSAFWCYLIALPVLVVNVKKTADVSPSPSIQDYIGWAIWAFGFVMEVAADRQKDAFRRDPANKGKNITVGLWSRSRHPNYFGEMTIWVGVVVSTASVFQAWGDWLSVLSPLTTWLLLMKVSGVPLLEKKAEERWGTDPEFRWYMEHTPCIIPSISRPPPYNPESAAVQMM